MGLGHLFILRAESRSAQGSSLLNLRTNPKDDDGTQAVQMIQYSGKVTNEKGTPVSGLSVMLEERTTDKLIETVTVADGSFSVEVAPGTYDVVFDDRGKVNYVTVQKTAVYLQKDKIDNVTVPTAGKLLENSLSFQVNNADGTPAASQKILIYPTIARSTPEHGEAEVPDPFMAVTDDQGRFTATLGEPGMDFDFDALFIAPGAPDLDEVNTKLKADYKFLSEKEREDFQKTWHTYLSTYVQEPVDIEKPNGPMHVDLLLGSAVRNLRGANGTPSVVASDAQKLREFERSALPQQTAWNKIKNNAIIAFLNIIPSAYAGEIIAKFRFDPLGFPMKGSLTNGKLAPTEKKCTFKTFLDMNDGTASISKVYQAFLTSRKICLQKAVYASQHDYAVTLSEIGGFSFVFKDASDKTYALKNTSFDPWNPLSENRLFMYYTSDAPSIVSIAYHRD